MGLATAPGNTARNGCPLMVGNMPCPETCQGANDWYLTRCAPAWNSLIRLARSVETKPNEYMVPRTDRPSIGDVGKACGIKVLLESSCSLL